MHNCKPELMECMMLLVDFQYLPWLILLLNNNNNLCKKPILLSILVLLYISSVNVDAFCHCVVLLPINVYMMIISSTKKKTLGPIIQEACSLQSKYPYTRMFVLLLLCFVITRSHSFSGTAEFRAEPRNLGFCRGIEPRNLTAEFVFLPRKIPRNLTFFIRTTNFSQKMTSK